MSLADVAYALSALHTLSAALGAAGITFGEIFYTKAIADGKINECEKHYIRSTFFALRWGLSFLILSGIALIIVEYFTPNAPQTVMTNPFWMAHLLTVAILVIGWLLSKSLVSWWLGSAAAFSAWWMILILNAWPMIPLGFLELVFAYIISIFLVAGFFTFVRTLIKPEPLNI